MRNVCNLFVSATPPLVLGESMAPLYALIQLSRPTIDRMAANAELCHAQSLHSVSWLEDSIRWHEEVEFEISSTRCCITGNSVRCFAVATNQTEVAMTAEVPLQSILSFAASGRIVAFLADFAWEAHEGGTFSTAVFRALCDSHPPTVDAPRSVHTAIG